MCGVGSCCCFFQGCAGRSSVSISSPTLAYMALGHKQWACAWAWTLHLPAKCTMHHIPCCCRTSGHVLSCPYDPPPISMRRHLGREGAPLAPPSAPSTIHESGIYHPRIRHGGGRHRLRGLSRPISCQATLDELRHTRGRRTPPLLSPNMHSTGRHPALRVRRPRRPRRRPPPRGRHRSR